MLREVSTVYETDEVLPVAQQTLATTLLFVARYLQARPLDAAEFWQALGAQLVPMWAEMTGATAVEVAHEIGLFFTAMGAAVASLHGDDTHAEITLHNVLPQTLRSQTHTTHADIKLIFKMWIPVLESLHLEYEWQIQKDQAAITLWRS